MTHEKFREILGAADKIGLHCEIKQIGRGSYSKKVKLTDGSHKRVVTPTVYRRKYQVVINFEIRGMLYCRRISAKEFIQKEYEKCLADPAYIKTYMPKPKESITSPVPENSMQ